jgi:hypothetical protein
MNKLIKHALLASAVAQLVGCGSQPVGGSDESIGFVTGAVTVAVQAPADYTPPSGSLCLLAELSQNAKNAAKTTVSFVANSSGTNKLKLTVPAGNVTGTFTLYDGNQLGTTCAGLPAYSATTSFFVSPGAAVSLAVTLKPLPGSGDVTISYGDLGCPADRWDPVTETCAPPAPTCVESDLALNPSGAGYPDPTQSDPGWGGGSFPWDLVDGKESYDTWARGLAFTGGHQTAAGGPPYLEPAGIRHAIIDFGATRSFDKIVLWWHGAEYTPDSGTIDYWDGSQWLAVGPTTRLYGTMHDEGSNSGSSDSDIYTFPTVTGSKVRYTFDNSGLNIVGTYDIHGWLYEFQVFGCQP